MKKISFLFLTISLVTCFLSCATSKSSFVGTVKAAPEAPLSSNQIVYLFLHIFKSGSGDHIQLTSRKIYQGELKPHENFLRTNLQQLIATFLDKRNNPLFQMTLPHPLHPVYEGPSGVNQGFVTKSETLQKADFDLRYQNNPAISAVAFSEVIDGKTTPLDTILLTRDKR